jgi:glucokinase
MIAAGKPGVKMDVLLCGDIGGTHTRLALVRQGALDAPIVARVYPSQDYAEFLPLLERFLAEAKGEAGDFRLRGAAFGIPGPVSATSEVLWMVNLPWRIAIGTVARLLKLERVRFLNDFMAVALSVPHLAPHHLHPLGGGPPLARGPIVVLGAGTGLGEGFLVWNGERYLPVPSEGGHADFAPRTALEVRLLEFLLARHGQVTWERVLSGPGLSNLYEFLREREGLAEAPGVREALAREDVPAAITRHGLGGQGSAGSGTPPDPLCARALDLFCTLYGAAAGNLALQVVATGGVYLAGGMARHVLGLLGSGPFRKAFEANRQFGDLLKRIPVWAIIHPNPGLLGAAIAAAEAPERA